MHRIDTSTAVAAMPAPAAPGPNPNGYWTPGNPGISPATAGDQDFFNMVQEELAAILTAAGIAPVKGTFNQVLAAIQKLINAGGPYVLLLEQQAQGTAGGTFTTGAWRQRTLNVKAIDTGAIVAAFASNQFALPAGTYRVRGSFPADNVDNHMARLQNVTDGVTVLTGTGEQTSHIAGDDQITRSWIVGEFTIAAQKTFEIDHQCGTTFATNGFGYPSGFAVETYGILEIWKIG